MNLLCPNCQKMLQVPEQYAGQMMKCPLCSGTFTVPALPQAPPPPPPPPAPTPPMPDLAGPPSAARSKTPAKEPPSPPGDYAHVRTFTLNPRLLSWLAPVCLALVFVLLFFTWTRMEPAGITVFSQSGWQAAFGGFTDNTTSGEIWHKYNEEDMKYVADLGSAFPLILFILIVVPTLLLAVAAVLIQRHILPIPLPAALEPLWAFRGLAIAALTLAALVLLLLQMLSGFPLENLTMEQAARKAAEGKPQGTEEDRAHIQMDKGKEYGKYNLQTTGLVSLTVFLLALACLGALLEGWLERRASLPPPRLDLHY